MRALTTEELLALGREERILYLNELRASLPSWEDIEAKARTLQESGESLDFDAEKFKEEMAPYVEEMNRALEKYHASK